MNYDPNMFCCGRMVNQTVRFVFGTWEYRKTIESVVFGNCQGLNVIEAGIENIYDNLAKDKNGIPEIILVDSTGSELSCTDDEECDSRWLKSMLVSAKIIDIKSVGE